MRVTLDRTYGKLCLHARNLKTCEKTHNGELPSYTLVANLIVRFESAHENSPEKSILE